MNLNDWDIMQPILSKMHESETKSRYTMAILQIIGGVILVPICFLILWGIAWVILGFLIYKIGVLDSAIGSEFLYSLYLGVVLFIFFAVGSFFVDFDELRDFEVVENDSIVTTVTGHADRENVGNLVKYFLYVAPRLLYVGSKDLVTAKKSQVNQYWGYLVFNLYSQRNAVEVSSLAESLHVSEASLYELLEERHEDVVIVGQGTTPKVMLSTRYKKKLDEMAGIENVEIEYF